MNVLRKAFQSNYLPIFSALLSNDNIKKVAMEIQSSLSICSSDPETGAQQIV